MKHNETCTAVRIGYKEDKKLLAELPYCQRMWYKLIIVPFTNPHALTLYRSEKKIRIERFKHIKSEYSYIVHPYSHIRTCYMAYQILLYSLTIILKSFELGFYTRSRYHRAVKLANLTLDVLNIMDIIFRFFIGYVRSGAVVLEQRLIALHYLLGPFFICDILSAIPTYWTVNEVLTGIFASVASLKIIRLDTILRYNKKILYWMGVRNQKIITLYNSTNCYLIISHFLTCFQISFFKILRR